MISALALLVLIGTFTSPVVPANAQCMPGRPNDIRTRWDGWWRDVTSTPIAIQSRIRNYDPWVHPDGASSAWVMLTVSPYQQWVQIGWLEFPYDDRSTFIEWTEGPGNVHNLFLPPEPTDELTYYKLSQTPGGFDFYINGYLVWHVGKFLNQLEGQIFGETKSLADQMPGGYSAFNYTWLDSSQLYHNGAWRPFNGNKSVSGGSQYYGWYLHIPGYAVGIWDKACPQ
jgi:hypothetical protein